MKQTAQSSWHINHDENNQVIGGQTSNIESKNSLLPILSTLAITVAVIGVLISAISNQSSSSNQVYAVSNPSTVNIKITANGFEPSVILVKPGTDVIWTNTTLISQQISSNPYPTHSSLPGLMSDLVPPTGTFSYVFDKSGQWTYQEFLNPTINGTVDVTH